MRETQCFQWQVRRYVSGVSWPKTLLNFHTLLTPPLPPQTSTCLRATLAWRTCETDAVFFHDFRSCSLLHESSFVFTYWYRWIRGFLWWFVFRHFSFVYNVLIVFVIHLMSVPVTSCSYRTWLSCHRFAGYSTHHLLLIILLRSPGAANFTWLSVAKSPQWIRTGWLTSEMHRESRVKGAYSLVIVLETYC